MQYWKQNNSKANKLIVIKDGVIYKGNPKYKVYNRLTSNAQLDFLEGLFSIPYSYITAIENQHGKNELKIYYRKDSEEELILEDEQVKNEIFEHLRQELPEFSYSKEHPSLWKYAKPQFFALLIVTGLYIYVASLANMMVDGYVFEIGGRIKGSGINGILLGVAQMGIVKITIGYSILLAIIGFRIFSKIKSRSEIASLKRPRR